MDTLLILLALAVLTLFWKRPRHIAGLILFWATWASTVVLFTYHVTSELPLEF